MKRIKKKGNKETRGHNPVEHNMQFLKDTEMSSNHTQSDPGLPASRNGVGEISRFVRSNTVPKEF